jgi:hypothetical protein
MKLTREQRGRLNKYMSSGTGLVYGEDTIVQLCYFNECLRQLIDFIGWDENVRECAVTFCDTIDKECYEDVSVYYDANTGRKHHVCGLQGFDPSIDTCDACE